MYQPLSAIMLKNFRSYDEASFEFDKGVNIVIGPNAVGKTNLLEAVHLACFGKGFRAKSDAELINNSQQWARVEAVYGNKNRIIKLDKSTPHVRLKKHIELGGRTVSRLGFSDIVPVVLFEPDILRLASGGPERRRTYLDTLLSKLIPDYRSDLHAYERIIKQRNALLKSSQSISPDQLYVWNIQLAERGAKLVGRRLAIVEQIQQRISTVYRRVAGSASEIKFIYNTQLSADNYANSLVQALEKSLLLDRQRGYTSYGPHRDDIAIKMNGHAMKDTASRGENRTLLLALKIIELELIEAVHGEKPLLLLDDVFSELDGSRRKLLTELLTSHQAIITTTDADVIGKRFVSNAKLITLTAN